MSYNGYENYETWNVCLWWNNDENSYHFYRHYAPFTARSVEEFVRENMPEGTPDFDSPADYDNVNWHEVAENFNE